MSRGAGRVERCILEAFSVPEKSYSVEDLFHLAYPNESRMERKHRVAIKRACVNVCAKTGWDKLRRDTRGGGYIYYDPCDVISYALARLKQMDNLYGRRLTDEEIYPMLVEGGKNYELVSEGGAWLRHTQMARAKRDGDEVTYQKLQAEQEASIAALSSGARQAANFIKKVKSHK